MTSSDPALLRPSKTAELAAAIRALHLRRVSPPVFEDHLAQAMCGPFWRTVVSSGVLSRLVVDGVLRRLAPIMPAVYVRARFGEDRLEEAVRQGLDGLQLLDLREGEVGRVVAAVRPRPIRVALGHVGGPIQRDVVQGDGDAVGRTAYGTLRLSRTGTGRGRRLRNGIEEPAETAGA